MVRHRGGVKPRPWGLSRPSPCLETLSVLQRTPSHRILKSAEPLTFSQLPSFILLSTPGVETLLPAQPSAQGAAGPSLDSQTGPPSYSLLRRPQDEPGGWQARKLGPGLAPSLKSPLSSFLPKPLGTSYPKFLTRGGGVEEVAGGGVTEEQLQGRAAAGPGLQLLTLGIMTRARAPRTQKALSGVF